MCARAVVKVQWMSFLGDREVVVYYAGIVSKVQKRDVSICGCVCAGDKGTPGSVL